MTWPLQGHGGQRTEAWPRGVACHSPQSEGGIAALLGRTRTSFPSRVLWGATAHQAAQPAVLMGCPILTQERTGLDLAEASANLDSLRRKEGWFPLLLLQPGSGTCLVGAISRQLAPEGS